MGLLPGEEQLHVIYSQYLLFLIGPWDKHKWSCDT